MRILLTGGAGFIGSHLTAQFLAEGHQVEVIDNCSTGFADQVPEGATLHQVDVRDAEKLQTIVANFQPEVVCHFAAQLSVMRSISDPRNDVDVNINGLLALLGALVPFPPKRFLFASSGGTVYGEAEGLITETHPIAPISPYGIAKFAAERYLASSQTMADWEVVSLRFGNVYGPRQNPKGESGVIAAFCDLMQQKKQVTIFGAGDSVRDYLYVDDAVSAVVSLLACDLKSRYEIFNVGTGTGTNLVQLEAELRNAWEQIHGSETKLPEPAFKPFRAGELMHNQLDCSRLTQFNQWSPQTNLSEGLLKTAHWFTQKRRTK